MECRELCGEHDKEVGHLVKQIHDDYGIKLTWQEVVALRHYANCCIDLSIRGHLADSVDQVSLHLFMIDYFGLKNIDLEGTNYRERNLFGRDDRKGLDLLGTPEFKEYCRRNVDKWREERTLP